MNEATFKAALRAAIKEAISEVGLDAFKQTSMFPLSRRRAAAAELRKAA